MSDDDVKKDDAVEESAAPATDEAPAEAPAEEVNEEPKKEEAMAELSTEGKKMIEQIENMTVLELHKLVKAIEEKFEVSAAAVAVAAPGAGGGDAAEEKDDFKVELKDAGGSKIQVIKAVKELLGLGLKEAKDLVDGAPGVLKEGVKKEEAEEMKAKIEEAGGTVELS